MCFEKAVEKCYDDSLSSIVTSCFLGKHVAVGTRSRFDVLRDWKEVGFDQMSKDNLVLRHGLGFDQMNGMDVYNFLHIVSSVGKTNSNTAYLGEEIDDIMEMYETNSTCLGEEVDLIEVDEVKDSSLRRRS